MARILIIDDSAAIGESLAYFFESEGHSVVVADNGAAGLRRAAEQPVDVVLLDVEMPGMSGFEVCRAMRDNPALCKLPVVMMTGRALRASTAPARAAGARLVVAKPFDLDNLHKMLSSFFPAPSVQMAGRR